MSRAKPMPSAVYCWAAEKLAAATATSAKPISATTTPRLSFCSFFKRRLSCNKISACSKSPNFWASRPALANAVAAP